jgi:hypothetical protein
MKADCFLQGEGVSAVLSCHVTVASHEGAAKDSISRLLRASGAGDTGACLGLEAIQATRTQSSPSAMTNAHSCI